MHATLHIDDDVLSAVEGAGFASEDELHTQLRALGVVPFVNGKHVTNGMIDALRDEEGI
jgi:hypothetical protein